MECSDFDIATSASVCNQDSKEGNGLGGLLRERHGLENHRHTVPGFGKVSAHRVHTELWVVNCQGLVKHSSILLSSLGRRGAGSAWNPVACISDRRFSMPFSIQTKLFHARGPFLVSRDLISPESPC